MINVSIKMERRQQCLDAFIPEWREHIKSFNMHMTYTPNSPLNGNELLGQEIIGTLFDNIGPKKGSIIKVN